MIELEILFENKTTYSKKSYEEFLEFHRKKFRFKYMLFNIIIIATILTCIIYLVSFRIYSTAIIFCIFLTAFIFLRFIKPISDVKKDYESEKIFNKKTFRFIFYDNIFTIEDEENFFKLKYKDLYKIFEHNNSFYLYTDKTHAILIDKNGFSKGNYSQFYKFIKKKIKFFVF